MSSLYVALAPSLYVVLAPSLYVILAPSLTTHMPSVCPAHELSACMHSDHDPAPVHTSLTRCSLRRKGRTEMSVFSAGKYSKGDAHAL